MKIAHAKSTNIGTITLIEENGYLTDLLFPEVAIPPNLKRQETSLLKEAFAQLDSYFAGKLKEFSLPLNPHGTEFMRKVWHALQTIPYGETVSYKDIAEQVGCPQGYRAVGLANNKNPIPIIIPCHRVIGTNGKLVGFALGLGAKQQLLDMEKQWC